MLNCLREKINATRLNAISYARKIRLSKQIDKTKVSHLEKTADCNHRWYGSSYGGFYINPDLLNATSIVYSFGIGTDITFDQTCIKKHGCNVFAFDPTPKSIRYIRNKKISPNFHFYEYGITATASGLVEFYLPANPKGTSGSLLLSDAVSSEKTIQVLMKTFMDISTELGHTHIDVLKLDIEGAEYDVLGSILDCPVTIDQILVEFHDRLFDLKECRSKEIVKKLNQHGYSVFAHSSTYEEISFIAKNKL